jgi:hypothetical protein
MRLPRFRVRNRPILLACLAQTLALQAWSPRFHETQTALAMRLIPRPMALFLDAHREELRAGARGIPSDRVPTVEEVEEQFLRVLQVSEAERGPKTVVRELGTLAHLVQLMTDPSATSGLTPLRENFEAYGDEYLPKLVVNYEPFWSVKSPLDPRPKLLEWRELKFERHRTLLQSFDVESGKRIGAWDTLSIPFAQLQLSFSNGVNATANIWILMYRAAGDLWPIKEEPRP